MGTADMQNAFNEVSVGAPAQVALLWNERDDAGKEWQCMLFRGTNRDGSAFEVRSGRHSPAEDPNMVARDTAQKFVDDTNAKDSA